MPFIVTDYEGNTICIDLKKVLYVKAHVHELSQRGYKSGILITFQGGEFIDILFTESTTAQEVASHISNEEW